MAKMHFEWVDYSPADAVLIDTWLDPYTVSTTGLDQGWNAYWQAVLADSKNYPGCIDHCKIVKENGHPVAAVCFGCYEGTATISEIVVDPKYRFKGHGTKIIQELLAHADVLIGTRNARFTAVIFPDNLPSKRVFAKAGFVQDHINADSWTYHPDNSFSQK